MAIGPIPFRSQIFFGAKSTNQALSTSLADLTTWLPPDREDSIYSLNTTTGVLTINKDGWFSFNFWGRCSNTGNGRSSVQVQLTNGSGTIIDTTAQDEQYNTRLSSVHEVGSVQFNNKIYEVSDGDTFKVQARYEGSACTMIYANLAVMEV